MKYSLLIILSIVYFAASAQNLKGKTFSTEILESDVYSVNGDTLKFEVVIDSFKGKIVYVDFWASWCGPCNREMPESKKVQKHYEGKDVVFLYLSTDKDNKNWQTGLKRIKIKGHHYRLETKTKVYFKNQLKIKGIPYYLILDGNSKFFDPKAKWPRQENLKIDLNEALKTI